MARGPRVTAAERDRILGLADGGASTVDVANLTGRPQQTVSHVIRSAGLDLVRSRAERMRRASQDFSSIRRLEMGNRFAEKLSDLLEMDVLDEKQASAMRNLAVSFGVLTDKRRLEEGQSTDNIAVNFRVWKRKSL